jgi:hypothetical protein
MAKKIFSKCLLKVSFRSKGSLLADVRARSPMAKDLLDIAKLLLEDDALAVLQRIPATASAGFAQTCQTYGTSKSETSRLELPTED